MHSDRMSTHWELMLRYFRRSGGCKLQPNLQEVSKLQLSAGWIHPDKRR
jgi:hypothetical protein